MSCARGAAVVHVAMSARVGCFPLAHAAGAQWGRLTLGGAFAGLLPTPLRLLAVVQASLLGRMA